MKCPGGKGNQIWIWWTHGSVWHTFLRFLERYHVSMELVIMRGPLYFPLKTQAEGSILWITENWFKRMVIHCGFPSLELEPQPCTVNLPVAGDSTVLITGKLLWIWNFMWTELLEDGSIVIHLYFAHPSDSGTRTGDSQDLSSRHLWGFVGFPGTLSWLVFWEVLGLCLRSLRQQVTTKGRLHSSHFSRTCPV